MMKKSFVFAIIALFVAAGVFAAQAAPFAVNRRKKELDARHTELTTLPYLKKASYAGLLAKAEKYEQEGKWIYAYGTYFDASLIADGDSTAKERAGEILSVIKDGNPGKGTFDVFSLHDEWVELIEESERYFTEFPAFEFMCSPPVQKEVHYDTKTADYEVTVKSFFTDKADALKNVLEAGYNKSKRADWNLYPWFLGYDANDGTPGHYFYQINRCVRSTTFDEKEFESRDTAIGKLKKAVQSAQKDGIYMNAYFNKKDCENIIAQMPAFYADVLLSGSGKRFRYSTGGHSFYDIVVTLCDKDGKVIAKSGRVNLKALGDDATYDSKGTKILFKNMGRDVMAKAAANELYVQGAELYLHYGIVDLPAPDTKPVLGLETQMIAKLPELKIDISKCAIFMFNEDEIYKRRDDEPELR